MEKIKFYFKAFMLITFSKEFQKFEKEFFCSSTEKFFQDGERIFTPREDFFLTIIKKCYN